MCVCYPYLMKNPPGLFAEYGFNRNTFQLDNYISIFVKIMFNLLKNNLLSQWMKTVHFHVVNNQWVHSEACLCSQFFLVCPCWSKSYISCWRNKLHIVYDREFIVSVFFSTQSQSTALIKLLLNGRFACHIY